MSINQYYYPTPSSEQQQLQEPHWWSHYNTTTAKPFNSAVAAPAMLAVDLNNDDDEEHSAETTPSMETNNTEQQNNKEEQQQVPKERLFEKPLTPSDVGKLNRLVIPKQHAEKHFPLNGSGGGDSAENGLLLGFEDELGKSWRFRYSYWNSSQSYVLTKGWSRFVKEKRLDAGDIVVFARHRVDTGRLFIGWRRRSSGEVQPVVNGGGWNNRVVYSPYTNQQQIGQSLAEPCLHAAAAGSQQSQQTAAGIGGGGNSKRVRLFGVNLDCQLPEPPTPDVSSQGQPHHLHYHPSNFHHHHYYSNHMDMISFSGSDNVYRQG